MRSAASGQLCPRSATRTSRNRCAPPALSATAAILDDSALTALSSAHARGGRRYSPGGRGPPAAIPAATAARPPPPPPFPSRPRRLPGAGNRALPCGGAAASPRCLRAPSCPHRPAGAGQRCYLRFSAAPFFALSPPVPPYLPLPAAPFLSHSAPRRAMDHNGEEGRGGGLPGRSAAGRAAAREGAAARGWGPPGPVLGKAAGRGGALGSGAGPELCPERRARGPLPQRPQAAAPRSVRLRRCAARPAAVGERDPRRSLLLVFLFFP